MTHRCARGYSPIEPVNGESISAVASGAPRRSIMKSLLTALTVAALAACSTTSPDVVSRQDAQYLSQVQDATVLSVRPVIVEGSQSGTGALAGGVVGGLAGSSHSNGRESVAIGVVGAVAGAVAGHAIERMSTREDAVEVLVQLRNGERRAIVQAKGQETLAPGDAVILISNGGRTRVTKAPATLPAAPRS
jgi:outer membrane lipoprotein SlyB